MSGNPWPLSKQFVAHRPGTPSPDRVGRNDFGRLEALAVYGKDRTTQIELAMDLDLAEVASEGGTAPRCVGLQLLCPRCGSPIYVKDKDMGGGHRIEVHWDKPATSRNDGLMRPTVTVDLPFGCDYRDFELSGVEKSHASHVVMGCNWRGGMTEGRLLDHSLSKLEI